VKGRSQSKRLKGARPATHGVAHRHGDEHHRLPGARGIRLTSLNLLGIRAFNLSTGSELPGEGPADDEALVQLVASIRQHLADSEPGSPE
jgi:hypothetical protein